MKARRTAITVLTCLTMLLAACAGQGSRTGADAGGFQPLTVSEVIRSVFYAPLYVADGAGIFASHGLDVTIETANGSDKVTAALLARQADVGLLGPESAVFLQNQDSARKVTVFHQLTQRDGSFLVGRNASADFSLEELSGTTIVGWRPGSMPQMVMHSLLQDAGVEPAEYITNIQAPAMAGAFVSGVGDVIQTFEPVTTTLLEKHGAKVLASVGQLADPFPYTVFATVDTAVTEDSERLRAFSAAISEATEFVLTRPADEVAAAVAKYFPGSDADADVLAAAIERYREADVWAQQPTLDPQQFERLQDIMVTGGVLRPDERVAYEKVVTSALVDTGQTTGGDR